MDAFGLAPATAGSSHSTKKVNALPTKAAFTQSASTTIKRENVATEKREELLVFTSQNISFRPTLWHPTSNAHRKHCFHSSFSNQDRPAPIASAILLCRSSDQWGFCVKTAFAQHHCSHTQRP